MVPSYSVINRTRNKGFLACASLFQFAFCRELDVGNPKSRAGFMDSQRERNRVV